MNQEIEPVSRLSSAMFIGLIVILLLTNLLFGVASNGGMGLTAVLFVPLVIFWVADSLFHHKLSFSDNWLQIPLIGMIVIGLIQLLPLGGDAEAGELLQVPVSGALTIIPFATKLAVFKLVMFLIFFAAALVYIDSPYRMRTVAFALIIYGAVISFIGILQQLSNPSWVLWIRQVDYATPFATYVNRHHFAAFLLMTISVTLGLLFAGSTKPDKRLLLVIAACLMGFGIVFTSSRGALISLIALLGMLTALSFLSGRKIDSKRRKKNFFSRVWILVGANAVLVIFLLISVAWIGGSDISLRSAGLTESADFSNGRVDFWANTLKIIRDNPILGTGLDTFEVAYTRYDTWNGQLRVNHAHNEYLHVFSEAGILGLLCVFGFIFLLFRQGLKIINSTLHPFRRGLAAGALAGCFGIMVHSFFDFPLRTNANMFCFLILATLATARVEFPVLIRRRKKIKEIVVEPKSDADDFGDESDDSDHLLGDG
ncbi:MAG: hypothetical protein HKN33_12795 [Pyrinomonadaceae bacterium]|nr:hypothetical protein [Pyrinomonadaceae bacterium]